MNFDWSLDFTESWGGDSVSDGQWLELCFNQVNQEFFRLPEIAAKAGCRLSNWGVRHCPYAIYDIACLRLDLISDCSVSTFFSHFSIRYYTKFSLFCCRMILDGAELGTWTTEVPKIRMDPISMDKIRMRSCEVLEESVDVSWLSYAFIGQG